MNTITEASEAQWGSYLATSPILLFCLYEIWEFAHGRATAIGMQGHDPTPKNTTVRLVGLTGDFVVAIVVITYQVTVYLKV